MSRRVAVTNLNASTIDVLNVIRQNASLSYQNSVPKVEKTTDIPKVGESIYGHPANANEFLNALVNRIALVKVTSAVFNNPYRDLKKGFLNYGESVEDIFVSIARVNTYNVEKSEEREFKRTVPDVKSIFYCVNWRVMYPVTIEDEELRLAFLDAEGVSNLIAKIVDSVYKAESYDEFLLFKYLIIKAVANGKMKAVTVGNDELKESAGIYRGLSNALTFMSKDYNEAGVRTATPRERQVIFMDAEYNGKFDVEVLASAFNLNKADFLAKLYLIDSFKTFDNERFEEIILQSDNVEKITDSDLALMEDVTAILCDSEFFQVYDNLTKFTEKYVASGMYWNYFLHTWKTVATSPFANAVVFVKGTEQTLPDAFTVHVSQKLESDEATTFVLEAEFEQENFELKNVKFEQTEELVTKLISVHPYGAYIVPKSASDAEIEIVATINGKKYKSNTKLTSATDVDDTLTMNAE